MRRWIIGTAATLLVLVGVFYLVRAPLTVALMERQIAANLSADPFSELDDGLHVALCGADVSGRPNIVKIMDDILDYYASPVEAAETAEAAGVGYLLYYHVVPPLPARGLEDVFTKGVGKVFRGTYAVGRDGLMISLPAGSKAIERNDGF